MTNHAECDVPPKGVSKRAASLQNPAVRSGVAKVAVRPSARLLARHFSETDSLILSFVPEGCPIGAPGFVGVSVSTYVIMIQVREGPLVTIS